jgi:hypothetical protein
MGDDGAETHHNHHHVHFGGAAESIRRSDGRHIQEIDVSQEGPFNLMFGMLKAKHTYTMQFSIRGANGRSLETELDQLPKDIDLASAHTLSVCKLPPMTEDADDIEGGGMGYQNLSTFSNGGAAHTVDSTSHQQFEVTLHPTEKGRLQCGFWLVERASTSDSLGGGSGVGWKVRVNVSAKVMSKTMGTPVLRDNVRCIAVDDDDDDSDAGSDWNANS